MFELDQLLSCLNRLKLKMKTDFQRHVPIQDLLSDRWETAKFLGFATMMAAVAIFAVLPWLDRSPVKSIKYKGILSKTFLGIFVVSFFALCYLGMVPPTETKTLLSKIFTLGYFSYFLLMPIYTRIEKCKPVPERVAEA